MSRRDVLRGTAAGAEATAVRGAAQAIFEAGGNRVLPVAVQRAVRSAVEDHATQWLAADAGKHLLQVAGKAATSAGRKVLAGASAVSGVEVDLARAAAARTLRGAGRQVLRGIGAAAGAGLVIDGGWALASAVQQARAGAMTRAQAAAHVAREAAGGAAATAAGTAAAALLVTLTGGVAAPAVFVVGAVTSLGAKAGIDALWRAGRRADAAT